MDIDLTLYELTFAGHIAVARHAEAIRLKCKRLDGTTPTWDEEVEGCCAELAVAKALGVPWKADVNAFDTQDVAGFGVRHTKRLDGRLIVRKRDFLRYGDDGRFMLVTGERCHYRVPGWATIADVRDRGEWSNPNGWGGAYFTPQSALRPVAEAAEALRAA